MSRVLHEIFSAPYTLPSTLAEETIPLLQLHYAACCDLHNPSGRFGAQHIGMLANTNYKPRPTAHGT